MYLGKIEEKVRLLRVASKLCQLVDTCEGKGEERGRGDREREREGGREKGVHTCNYITELNTVYILLSS